MGSDHGVRLLEGQGGGVLCGEEKTTRRVCDAGARRRRAVPGRGPEEEHRIYALQRRVQRLGHGEVAGHDLDCRRQPRRCRSARERAHRHTRVQQLGDHRASDSAGGARHEDGRHACGCHDAY